MSGLTACRRWASPRSSSPPPHPLQPILPAVRRGVLRPWQLYVRMHLRHMPAPQEAQSWCLCAGILLPMGRCSCNAMPGRGPPSPAGLLDPRPRAYSFFFQRHASLPPPACIATSRGGLCTLPAPAAQPPGLGRRLIWSGPNEPNLHPSRWGQRLYASVCRICLQDIVTLAASRGTVMRAAGVRGGVCWRGGVGGIAGWCWDQALVVGGDRKGWLRQPLARCSSCCWHGCARRCH